MAMELCLDLAVGVTSESARAYVDSLGFRRPFQRTVEQPVADATDVCDVEFEHAVRTALPYLTSDEASALWLVDVCRVSYTEAAESMRISKRTVERHVSSGRRRIRNSITVS